ncbi:MAG: C39 family peptidase [Patescibacteria group bacterium]
MPKRAIGFFIIFSTFFLLFSLFSSFDFAFAQGRQLEIDYPNVPGAPTPKTTATLLPDYVKYVFNFGIIIFGLIVLGVLVAGGIKYLLSTGKPEALQEAKNQILAAFLGIIVLLSSYLILTTINPQLVIFNIPGLTQITVFRCTTDESCNGRFGCETPGTCRCDLGICRAKLEPRETTLIAYEIPVGQLIEKGVQNENNINEVTILLNEFEKFLKKEIPVDPPSYRLSDLSKHLVGLTEDCSCDATEGICATPEAGAGGVGCFGNPCKDSEEEIQKAVDITSQKIRELQDFKNEVKKQFQIFLQEGEKFLKANEEINECIENGKLLTLADYLATSQFFTEQGWKTQLKSNPYFPSSGGDDLTFYCIKGGTIFDAPRTSSFNIPEIPLELNLVIPTEPLLSPEPLSCPAILPLGEMLDNITIESYTANEDLESLIVLIDLLSKELQKLLDSVSSCSRKDACSITCAKGPNPCFPERPCAQPWGVGYPCFRCNPLSLPPCLLCGPGMGLSPNIQARGGGSSCQGNPDAPYHGSPCPRDDIEKTLQKIKLLDNEIIELIQETKNGFNAKPYIIETPKENINLLQGIRGSTAFCTSDDINNPDIFLLNCLDAIGNEGPDGNIIGDCDPQSFFCCTADKTKAGSIRQSFPRETQEFNYYTGPRLENPFSPAEIRNNVPYFSQKDPLWAGRSYGCGGTTIKSSGCGPTSMAMVLRHYGKNVDPVITAEWSLRNNFRVCNAGTAWSFFNSIAKSYGLNGCKPLSVANIDNLIAKLSDGPIIVSGRGNPPYSKGGHYIVLTGADENYVYINDPARPKLKRKLIDEFRIAGRARFACQVKQ